SLNGAQAPGLCALLPETAVNSVYSRLGVTFSRSSPLSLCPGTWVYTNDYGLLGSGVFGFHSGQNNISVCPLGVASDFSQYGFGVIKATFAIPAAQACISAARTGYDGLFPQIGGRA